MDELSDIEARHDANAENLRRAFGGPVGGEPPAFAALLERLAARGAAAHGGHVYGHARGAVLASAAMSATRSRSAAET
jgi:hypothetical protein